ncbi:OprO/OprP family phosphate-selective porin [Novosphingobium sp. Leaf2]|uniref:OprO/OprP family phosphate-selective porin n=1 Tax=Novosphingobium sp. Leaf2 TaxID=1735670 RepID=UPI0007021B7E|nr:porin [Novosphingobium sp. Leaf2]KQM18984.1 porin [Novosphingobium sp. Leaf2]
MTSSLLRGGCAALALIAATPALAAEALTNADLADLVRAQAAQIATLKARLDKLEGHNAAMAAAQSAPAPTPAPQMAQREAAPPLKVSPFAPQIVPPGPADIDVAQARAIAANEVGLKTEWGAGLPVFRSADGVFTYKPRGRILVDVSSTGGSKYQGRNTTTTGMRALRLGLEGGVGPHFFYQFETDFSENEVDIVTAFMGWRNKISNKIDYDVRVGHLFNDRSFEGSTGSDSTPFLERSTVSTAIIPQRGFYGIGIMGRMFGPNWHASVAVTGDRVDGEQATNDSRTVSARAHWNPIKTDTSLLHVGLWGFDEALSSAATTLTRNTVIGGRFNGAVRVSTGELLGGRSTTGYGVELGGYTGGLWVMGEAGQRIARLDAGRPDFKSKAWSVSTGLFLTGELPPYNPRLGSFGQPKVLDPVLSGGTGAIELTARYENLDYTDLILGGDGWAATLGVNWYLNSFTRFQLNGIQWHTDNRSGAYTGSDDGQTVSARVGVTF